MLRPARRAVDEAAVERGGVVRLDRAEVLPPYASIGTIRRIGEPLGVEAAQDREDVGGDVAVHDDPPGAVAAVEAPVRRRDDAQVTQRNRAAGPP